MKFWDPARSALITHFNTGREEDTTAHACARNMTRWEGLCRTFIQPANLPPLPRYADARMDAQGNTAIRGQRKYERHSATLARLSQNEDPATTQ